MWKCRSCRSRRNIISARRGISATLRFPRTGRGVISRCFWNALTGKARSGLTTRIFPAKDSLGTPHITDLGILTPGKHRLTIRVDNRLQLPAAGHLVDSHSISDSLGAAWNGIVGKIELRATSPVWIEDLQVFPHVATKSVTVKGRIGNITGEAGNDQLHLIVTPFRLDAKPRMTGNTNITVTWSTNGGTFETELSLRSDVKFWDEFDPTIYRLAV